MIPLVALLMCLSPISAEVETADSAATDAAESYRKLFEQIETFEEELGESYNAILDPEEYPDVVVSEGDRARIEKELDAQFEQLSRLAREPNVDWGRKAKLEEQGPMAALLDFAPIRHITNAAIWLAENRIEEDPDRAINGLMDAMSLARQQNQEATLISHLMHRATNNMAIDALAELSPQMTSAQREAILQRIHQLPETGTLEDALTTERDYFVGWFQRRIFEELEIWETENSGSHGYRFPEDLRLAGIVLLSDKPARISLHNTVKNQTFWLEVGQEINGISLEKVDKETSQAWIQLGEETAVIDLKKSTIQSRYVPVEVMHKILVQFGHSNADSSEAEMLEELKENGFDPETILADLATMQAHYNEVIQRLNGSVEEFQEWEEATLATYDEDSAIGMYLPNLSRIVELDRAYERKQAALEYAFTIMNESPPSSEVASSVAEDFGYAETENGFTITPVEYIEHERAERYTLTIGKASE